VLSGRCGCNAIAYEVDDAFVAAFNCHCSNCRATTGSAFLPWGEIEREKLRVTKGAGSLLMIPTPTTRFAAKRACRFSTGLCATAHMSAFRMAH
jgi:hypothetical protein